MLNMKKAARTMVPAIAAAAAFTMVMPTGTAFAINKTSCTSSEPFLRIHSHNKWGQQSEDCYANAGKTGFGGWWVDEISTGNNRVKLYDHNGSVVTLPAHRDEQYPQAKKIDSIEIY